MRVLHISDLSAPIGGGAALSDLAMLTKLAARPGWNCRMLAPGPSRARRWLGSVQLVFFRDFEELRQELLRFEPDLLFCSMDGIYDGIRLGKRYAIPSIAYLHSFEYCPPSKAQAQAWRVGKPPRPGAQCTWALQQADGLAVNSHFMQDYLLRGWDLPSRVFYPEFQEERFLFPRAARPSWITGICGLPHKGSRIFLELARAFPEQKFLLVGAVLPRLRKSLQQLSNVRHQAYADPRTFLPKTRLLLAPSQWAEPFGRIVVEAMANAIPVLASQTGGLTEIVGDSPLAVRAFRKVGAWESRLALVLANPQKLLENAWLGVHRAGPFLRDTSSQRLAAWIEELVARPKTPRASRVIHWQGERNLATAYSLINRHWAKDVADTDGLADITIHHDYRQNFRTAQAPTEGKWVAVRTWDFGPYPPSWVEKIQRDFDQLWVYSRWTRNQAIASGIPAARVKVVPPGVDLSVFKPEGQRYPLGQPDSCRFVFVGAAIYRKGIDILLKAFLQAFTARDRVCLVIKDNADAVFYQGQSYARDILEAQKAAQAPEIIYIQEHLPQSELADLYRSCDVAVFPYRAEGFALPILEALACGLAVVVPDRGPCRDYCRADCGYFVKTRRFCLPLRGDWAYNTLGYQEDLQEIAFLEVDPEKLAETLRQVVSNPAERLRKASRAPQAASLFGWEQSRQRLKQALDELAEQPMPLRFQRQRQEQSRQLRLLKATRDWLSGRAPILPPATDPVEP